jgi:hypothetical protein
MQSRPDLDPALDPQHCQQLKLEGEGNVVAGLVFYYF